MEERFSSYLSKIGLLNEIDSSSLIKKDDKASNKSFADTSFECLKYYFDNLDEEQKKYMSLEIPSKYILILDKIKRTKLKSIIIQLILRHRNILLKYFLIWKNKIYLLNKLNSYYSRNINILNDNNNQNENKNEINEKENSDLNSGENLFNNIANKYLNNEKDNKKNEQEENNNINIDEYKDNISAYNIVNIDANIDIDDKNITKTEEEEKYKINKSNKNNNSISFGNMILNNNSNSNNDNNNYYKKIKNPKNINPQNIKKINIKNNNKEQVSLKPYYYKDNNKNINQIKKEVNITSYKTINTNNMRKQTNRSQHSTNNNNNSYIRNSNQKTNLHTSLEEKEIRELKECTFKPKINNPSKKLKKILSQNEINSSLVLSNNNNYDSNYLKKREEEIQYRFEKLYKDNEKYKLSKEMKAKEREKIISLNTPFIPNAKKTFKKKLNQKRQKSEGNFEERQKDYINKKNKHSAEIKNRIDSEYEELCSFNPKITNDKGEYYKITKKEKINTKPVFIRLYEDGKDRKNYQIQKEYEKINKIMDLSNIINPNKNFNFERINKLYENREKRDIYNKTKRKVEQEEGITFKPYISENSYSFGINSNFYERGQKLLNDRESFYEEENKKYKEELRKRFIDNKNYTKEERKQIIDNIINRLYNDSVNINKKNAKEEKEEKDEKGKKEQKLRNFKSYCESLK